MRALYAEACRRACRRSSDIRVLSTRRRRAVRQLSGLRVPFSKLLFCLATCSVHVTVTQCPVSFSHVVVKGHSSCPLVFHQWNVSPILCCSSVGAWCIYAAVFVLYSAGRRSEGSPWGPSVLRVICVTIALSYNRGCTIAQWLRRSRGCTIAQWLSRSLLVPVTRSGSPGS